VCVDCGSLLSDRCLFFTISTKDDEGALLRAECGRLAVQTNKQAKKELAKSEQIVANQGSQERSGLWNLGDSNHGIACDLLAPAAHSVGFVKSSDAKWQEEHNFKCKEAVFKNFNDEEREQCMGFCKTRGMRGISEAAFEKHVCFLRQVVRVIRTDWRKANKKVTGDSRHLLFTVQAPQSGRRPGIYGWLCARPSFSPLEVDMIHVAVPQDMSLPFVAKLCTERVPDTKDQEVLHFITTESVAMQLSHIEAEATGHLQWQMLDYSLRWDTPLSHLHVTALNGFSSLDEFAAQPVDPVEDLRDLVGDLAAQNVSFKTYNEQETHEKQRNSVWNNGQNVKT
jgi:hypothetical protein